MSGDVQPRKRKDKKRKKDDLGVEEPRGTAAVLGEGDVFMHSQHEHGTGGHWCAKIIFFSLLAVLVTLIGLIILENRGLTELEANSVESRYSGVLDGWLEDAPDDDHHDEHTLELLKQHDDEEDDHDHEHDISQEEDHGEDDEHDEIDDDHDDDESEQDEENDDENEDKSDENDDEDDDNDDENDQDNDEDDQEASNEDEREDDDDEDQQDDENSEEQAIDETNEDDDDDDDDEPADKNDESDEDNNDDELQDVDENDTAEDDDNDDLQNDQADQSEENDDDENDDHTRDDEDSHEEEHEEHEEEQGDLDIEVEKLEQEVSDEDALSEEQPTQDEENDDQSQDVSTEQPQEDNDDAADEVDDVEDEEFLEADDEPLPVVERIVVPKGKPLAEVEDEPTTAKPADTLAEEDEYEKQQEELRREQAQASHVWLKLLVGGALLVATHAVVSRAVAPRDDTPASEGHASREDTPSMIDRRMTLIPEETAQTAASTEVVEEIVRPVIEEKVFQKVSPLIKSQPQPIEESEDEEIEEEEEVIIDIKDTVTPAVDTETEHKELYSDEEEIEEEDEEIVAEKKEAPKQDTPAVEKVVEPELEEPEGEEDVPDDVEIIDDEQLEEELEEEDDEEEISDVDDADLLSRLEAKYGRLPEPERPQPKNKDGGNSIEDDWPGEPSESYWRQQLDEAEQELRQGAWSAAGARVSEPQLRGSARARWTFARSLDAAAEAQRDNRLLSRAIVAYLDVLKMNDRLSDVRLREVAHRTLDRIRFRGTYLSAEPVYRLLIRRFPDEVDYRHNLTKTLFMADRTDLAEEVNKETLRKWPNDRIALAHHGFVLKTIHNRLEEAVEAFQKALEDDIGPATEPRFYYHLGDALLLLNRFTEADDVHKRGTKLGHFLSPVQRSLYNVERLKSRPWWNIEQTPYLKLARALEKHWREILKEGLDAKSLFEQEDEKLKERGEWSQLHIFSRGQEAPNACKKAPVTCNIVRMEPAAVGCRRGQIKFSAMDAGTYVRRHVGPTNCRLRMHLGLSNTKDTYIRVDKEIRQWQVGKVFMFDDSFEHEVWHNGTGTRLVLIVDVWHPDLTPTERRQLPAI